jgi:predicted nucleic acid-binding protein
MKFSPEWETSRMIVVDANIAVRAVIHGESAAFYLSRFEKWREDHVPVFAPAFWEAEVVSAIRQYVYRKEIISSEAHEAVDAFFHLRVEIVPHDKELCRRALDWAEAIGQSKVYDSLYLALAERLHADFWTADKKLADAARAAGATWAHWAGEA